MAQARRSVGEETARTPKAGLESPPVDISALGAQIRRRRRKLPETEQFLASAQVAKRLSTADALRSAKVVAVYSADDGEVDLRPLISWLWEGGVSVTFPVVDDEDRLTFALSRPHQPAAPGRFGIRVPPSRLEDGKPTASVAAGGHDVILMPGVLFGPAGARVGRGSGCYDAALTPILNADRGAGDAGGGAAGDGNVEGEAGEVAAVAAGDEDDEDIKRVSETRPTLIGVGHEFQWTPNLPKRRRDAAIDAFVSPACVRVFKKPDTPWETWDFPAHGRAPDCRAERRVPALHLSAAEGKPQA